MLNVLCIQAHDDDCIISIGGTLRRLASRGANVWVLDVTDGRFGSHNTPPGELVAVRREEAMASKRLLGVNSLTPLEFCDGSLRTLGEEKVNLLILELSGHLEAIHPDVVIIPSRSDGHPDHSALHDICLSALALNMPTTLIGYQVWLLPDFLAVGQETACSGVIVVGVDMERAAKERAIRAHMSQSGGEYLAFAESLSRYLAVSLRASYKIASQYAEVLGIYSASGDVQPLLRLLAPAFLLAEQRFGPDR